MSNHHTKATDPTNVKIEDVTKLFNEMKNLLEELKTSINQISTENVIYPNKKQNITQ